MYYLRKSMKKAIGKDARKSGRVTAKNHTGQKDPTAHEAFKKLVRQGRTDSRTL